MLMPDISKELLSSILSSIDEGIHVVDTEGVTVYYNEVAAKHDGLKVKEVLGKHVLEAFPSLSKTTSTLLKTIYSGKPIYNMPQTYLNLHGKKIETINTTLPIMIENKLLGAVEIAKDYTRMKVLSEKLIDLQAGLNEDNEKKKTSINRHYALNDLKTVNKEFQELKEMAKKLSKSNAPILIYGESGTGKELFVQGMHRESNRSGGPFIAQNCAALPETLLESILFGTAKGSYTGAFERKGLFELADGGTLFLDELHTMPIELQAKLLRVIEDGVIRRIGGASSVSVNVRVIAAMNIHPQAAVEEKQLRADLFYRLNVFTFSLIPLRERKEDILYLADYFIRFFNQSLETNITGMASDVQDLFYHHEWPGNVRELKHTIEYMMNITAGPFLSIADLPPMFRPKTSSLPLINQSLSLRENLVRVEKNLIEKALEITEGNINKASKLLNIPRQTLQYKLQKMIT